MDWYNTTTNADGDFGKPIQVHCPNSCQYAVAGNSSSQGRTCGVGKRRLSANTGGRFGNIRLSPNAKRARSVTNFTIASYGAAIKAIAEGMKTYQAVIQAILTGKPEEISLNIQNNRSKLSNEESELLNNLATSASGAFALVYFSPAPTPIKEFCSRPENINLKGVCK